MALNLSKGFEGLASGLGSMADFKLKQEAEEARYLRDMNMKRFQSQLDTEKQKSLLDYSEQKTIAGEERTIANIGATKSAEKEAAVSGTKKDIKDMISSEPWFADKSKEEQAKLVDKVYSMKLSKELFGGKAMTADQKAKHIGDAIARVDKRIENAGGIAALAGAEELTPKDAEAVRDQLIEDELGKVLASSGSESLLGVTEPGKRTTSGDGMAAKPFKPTDINTDTTSGVASIILATPPNKQAQVIAKLESTAEGATEIQRVAQAKLVAKLVDDMFESETTTGIKQAEILKQSGLTLPEQSKIMAEAVRMFKKERQGLKAANKPGTKGLL